MNASHKLSPESPRGLVPVVGDATVLTPELMAAVEPNDGMDVQKIWSAIWRNRWLIAAVLAASIALGVMSLFLSDPIYRATASIEINDQPVKVLGTEDFQQVTNPQQTERLLQTQVDILRSRSVAERVASDLKLASNDRFLKAHGVEPKPGILQEQVVQTLRNSLVVSLPRNTRVIPVNFESTDPRLAAQIVNRYVEILITGNLQRHFNTSRYSKEFLQDQLTLTKARLENSERALLSYARSVGIVDPSAGAGDPSDATNRNPRSLTSANLIDLNQSLATAKANRIQAEGRWRQAQGTPAMSLPEVLSNPAVQQLTQRRAEAEARYQQELQQRKAEHPAVQQLAASLRELDRQIGSLAGSIRNSIRNEYGIAQKQEAELAGTVAGLKGATMAEQQLGIRYNILKRDLDTNRELYDGLLQRYKQVSAEAGVTSNNIAILDQASPPLLPVSPRPVVNLTLALLLGLMTAGLLVAGRELFHDGVRTPDEVEQRFGVALLGHVPQLGRGESPVQALAIPGSTVSEAYQAVRTSLELSTEFGTPKTMLVTSSRAGEGKSTTALALARDAAVAGRRILLIDADMRRPSLHSHLSVGREPGLSNFLTQQLPIEAVIHETDMPGLSFMPAGPKPPNPAELVSGAAIRTLLGYLREEYDQIIIDSPPVLGLADGPRLASVVDATLLVIEANKSHRGAINAAVRRLNAARANLVGAVLVKLDPAKADFGSQYLFEYYSYGDFNQNSRPAGATPAVGVG